MNVYTYPALLDVAGAMEALPVLGLGGIAGRQHPRRRSPGRVRADPLGTDDGRLTGH